MQLLVYSMSVTKEIFVHNVIVFVCSIAANIMVVVFDENRHIHDIYSQELIMREREARPHF